MSAGASGTPHECLGIYATGWRVFHIILGMKLLTDEQRLTVAPRKSDHRSQYTGVPML
jgi:hypothetical protein